MAEDFYRDPAVIYQRNNAHVVLAERAAQRVHICKWLIAHPDLSLFFSKKKFFGR